MTLTWRSSSGSLGESRTMPILRLALLISVAFVGIAHSESFSDYNGIDDLEGVENPDFALQPRKPLKTSLNLFLATSSIIKRAAAEKMLLKYFSQSVTSDTDTKPILVEYRRKICFWKARINQGKNSVTIDGNLRIFLSFGRNVAANFFSLTCLSFRVCCQVKEKLKEESWDKQALHLSLVCSLHRESESLLGRNFPPDSFILIPESAPSSLPYWRRRKQWVLIPYSRTCSD